MKLTIQEDSSVSETEINILCSYISNDLRRIISTIHSIDTVLIGYQDKSCSKISVDSICYIDTVENKTFLYTNNSVYLCKEKLYELEDRLRNIDFFRINKNTIVNLRQIRQVNSIGISRLELVLKNKEKLIVNRNFLQDFKEKFGILR